MTSPPDEHVSGSGAPPVELQRGADRDDATHGGAHARRPDVPQIEAPRHPPPERRRYFLSSFEPSGEFDAVIVAVTHDERRRYFTTSDGGRLAEVDEVSFERRRESGTRSILELDERELGELEVELQFVRPVRGRDPIAEAEAEADAADDDEVEDEPVATAEDEPKAAGETSETTADVPADVSPVDAAADEATADAPETDPPIVHRATFTPPEDMTEEARDGDEHDEEVDPVTEEFEEFEEMVMASTTMTAEWVDDAASGIDEAAQDDAPTPSPGSIPPADAIAQVALAKGIAFIAHRGKHDRSGAPYIDHPGRIAERFNPITETVAAAAAWLHDVLEDTPITAQELLEAGVMPQIVEVVQLLTRTPDISADEYYAAIRRDPIARRVKLADIDDNTARWRLRRLD